MRYRNTIVQTNVNYTYSLLQEDITALKAKYLFLESFSIGKSVLGKDLTCLRLGIGEKEVFYNGSFHANESITSPVLMKFIEDFCEAAVNNADILGYNPRNIFNAVSLYIVPMVNPDGVDLVNGSILPGSSTYIQAENIASNFPTISFPSGWKANIRGVDFSYFHIILKKYDFLSSL